MAATLGGTCACVGRSSLEVASIDSDGFTEFWRAQRPQLVRALSFALGDTRLASEATDEALVRALERWPKVRELQQPGGWVYRVGYNWATSWRRKLSLRPTRPAEHLDTATVDELPDPDLIDQLRQLRPSYRNAVVMRYYLQLTPTEIAAELDLPVGTVKSNISRGLAQLRESRGASHDR